MEFGTALYCAKLGIRNDDQIQSLPSLEDLTWANHRFSIALPRNGSPLSMTTPG